MINIIKKQLANFLTIINLGLGLSAIWCTFENEYTLALILLLSAALTDRMDGWVARKLNTVSTFGKYLDSNSDLISFGLAPAIFLFFSVTNVIYIEALIGAFLFVIAGAIRLARYNAVQFDGVYRGIPITIAGALVVLLYLTRSYINVYIILGIEIALAYLMISGIKIKKR